MSDESRSAPQRHIVVLGGGGFSMEPRNRRMDDYILDLACRRVDRSKRERGSALSARRRRRLPAVCFLPTASGDSRGYIARFYRAFPPTRARASHLPLFQRDGRDLATFLLSQDVVYVGGGNTANLLAVWRLHGVDRIMRKCWQRGIVLCGVSAGMLCWFEGGVTDSFGPLAALRDGLGLLPGTACPHYNGEGRRPAYHRLVGGGLAPGFAAEDGAALHFVGTRMHACVTSRPSAKAYRVERKGRGVVESAIEADRLPLRGCPERAAGVFRA